MISVVSEKTYIFACDEYGEDMPPDTEVFRSRSFESSPKLILQEKYFINYHYTGKDSDKMSRSGTRIWTGVVGSTVLQSGPN